MVEEEEKMNMVEEEKGHILVGLAEADSISYGVSTGAGQGESGGAIIGAAGISYDGYTGGGSVGDIIGTASIPYGGK